MKLKVYSKKLIIYNLVIIIAVIIFSCIGILDKLFRYIKFETTLVKFQDLLSISITILVVFVGAIITVATVLISMCDKRIIKLITGFGESEHLIIAIKTAIKTGLISIILLAIVYARVDFNIFIIRNIILYITGYLLVIFTIKSKLLIKIVLSILNESFKDSNTFVAEAAFKKPKSELTTKNKLK